jgi:hypothetical protein
VVALVGEAAVGKSRLVSECVRTHHAHGWLVLHARIVEALEGLFADWLAYVTCQRPAARLLPR